MTLNGHFALNYHYYEQPFEKLFYILTVKSVYTHVTSGHVRKWTVIRIIFGIGRKKLPIFRNRRYIVGTLTCKANIS